jgi:hypothetical protein
MKRVYWEDFKDPTGPLSSEMFLMLFVLASLRQAVLSFSETEE